MRKLMVVTGWLAALAAVSTIDAGGATIYLALLITVLAGAVAGHAWIVWVPFVLAAAGSVYTLLSSAPSDATDYELIIFQFAIAAAGAIALCLGIVLRRLFFEGRLAS